MTKSLLKKTPQNLQQNKKCDHFQSAHLVPTPNSSSCFTAVDDLEIILSADHSGQFSTFLTIFNEIQRYSAINFTTILSYLCKSNTYCIDSCPVPVVQVQASPCKSSIVYVFSAKAHLLPQHHLTPFLVLCLYLSLGKCFQQPLIRILFS